MNNYYIPISRRLFEHQFWCEERIYSRFEAWLDLIQGSRFEDTKQLIGNRMIEVRRGQMLVSLRYLSMRWKWSTKKVSSFLDLLVHDNMIIKEMPKETGQTVITICNYDKYNGYSSKNKQQVNRKETAKETPKETAKETEKETQKETAKKVVNIYNNDRYDEDGLNEETAKETPKETEKETPKETPKETARKQQGNSKETNINKENKEKKDNNIPPTPPKGDVINIKARSLFEEFFLETYGDNYYWTAKDAGAMSQLLKKLRFQREQKNMDVSDDSLLYALKYLISSITDSWICDNFSVTNINSKFNEIISQARKNNGTKRITNIYEQKRIDSERRKSQLMAEFAEADARFLAEQEAKRKAACAAGEIPDAIQDGG